MSNIKQTKKTGKKSEKNEKSNELKTIQSNINAEEKVSVNFSINKEDIVSLYKEEKENQIVKEIEEFSNELEEVEKKLKSLEESMIEAIKEYYKFPKSVTIDTYSRHQDITTTTHPKEYKTVKIKEDKFYDIERLEKVKNVKSTLLNKNCCGTNILLKQFFTKEFTFTILYESPEGFKGVLHRTVDIPKDSKKLNSLLDEYNEFEAKRFDLENKVNHKQLELLLLPEDNSNKNKIIKKLLETTDLKALL